MLLRDRRERLVFLHDVYDGLVVALGDLGAPVRSTVAEACQLTMWLHQAHLQVLRGAGEVVVRSCKPATAGADDESNACQVLCMLQAIW